MGPQAFDIPYRYITWRLIEFQMNSLQLALRVFPGDLDRAIMFVLVARLACGDWATAAGIQRPAGHRPFSINSLAASLSRPFETVRRHVHGMIDAGVCARTDDGIILSPTTAREADIVAYYQATADLLRSLAARLADHGVPIPQANGTGADQLGPLVKASLDTGLVAIENHLHTHWYELILHGTLIYENGRDIMGCPEKSRIYGNLVLTADQRRPARIREMASVYGMPYPTVRRHIDAMMAAGALQKKAGGYILDPEWTGDDDRIAMSNQTVDYLLRQFRLLAAAGVDFCSEPARPDIQFT
jgi:predicted transcriptional regulator